MSKKIADLEKEVGEIKDEPEQGKIDKAMADALRADIKAAKESKPK